MKANELQLNDLVNLDYSGIPEIGKVTALYDDGEIQVSTYGAVCDDVSGDCTPIQLTEMMFEINGFKHADFVDDPLSDYWYMDDLFILIAKFNSAPDGLHFSGQWQGMGADGQRYPRYGVFSCKYVHELQHFLRVAGLADLADNFKIE